MLAVTLSIYLPFGGRSVSHIPEGCILRITLAFTPVVACLWQCPKSWVTQRIKLGTTPGVCKCGCTGMLRVSLCLRYRSQSG